MSRLSKAQRSLRHLTLFTKTDNGRYDPLIGAFYCEAFMSIHDENEAHTCPVTERQASRKKGGPKA